MNTTETTVNVRLKVPPHVQEHCATCEQCQATKCQPVCPIAVEMLLSHFGPKDAMSAVVSILTLLLQLALLGGAVWVVCAVLKAFGII